MSIRIPTMAAAALLAFPVSAAPADSATTTEETAQAAGNMWLTDFKAAQEQAKNERKAILVDFTGSDWCRYCILLREEILDTPEFADFARDKFVLMEVDTPKKQIPAELSIQNSGLCKKYDVRSFPTVLVLAPNGDVLGGFIGGATEFAGVRDTLEAAYKNLDHWYTYATTKCEDPARHLMHIYESLPPDIKPKAQRYKDKILRLDPEDTCGLRAQEKAAEQMDGFRKELRATGDDLQQALTLIETLLEKADPRNKSELLLYKSQALTYTATTVEDILKAKEILLQAIDLQQNEMQAKVLRENLLPKYNDPETLLRKVEARRK